MDLKEFYTSQSESVKAKLGACKSEEEMMQVLGEEGIELAPEVLDTISGGEDSNGEEITPEVMQKRLQKVKDLLHKEGVDC